MLIINFYLLDYYDHKIDDTIDNLENKIEIRVQSIYNELDKMAEILCNRFEKILLKYENKSELKASFNIKKIEMNLTEHLGIIYS